MKFHNGNAARRETGGMSEINLIGISKFSEHTTLAPKNQRRRSHRRRIAGCLDCGRSFATTRSDSRFCSPKCKQAAWRALRLTQKQAPVVTAKSRRAMFVGAVVRPWQPHSQQAYGSGVIRLSVAPDELQARAQDLLTRGCDSNSWLIVDLGNECVFVTKTFKAARLPIVELITAEMSQRAWESRWFAAGGAA